MPEVEPLAWVYSLDDLRYAHEERHATPLHAGTSTPSEVVFGRRVDRARDVSVAMTRADHPFPSQVSAVAGRVFVPGKRRSVWLANLSTSHPLYARRWPSAHLVHTLKPAIVDADPDATILGEGLWWIWTSEDANRTPGWVLVDVLKRKSARPLGSQSSNLSDGGTDPDPSTHQRTRHIELDNSQIDFLVATFAEYFTIPPHVRPTPTPASRVSDRATAMKKAIIKEAKPGAKGEAWGLYNSDLLPFLFRGDGGLTFTDVQQALYRLEMLD